MDGKDGLEDYTHYLTIDDDLGYPEDYVSSLVREFDARGGKAIVGVHGSTFLHPVKCLVQILELPKGMEVSEVVVNRKARR